MDSKDAYFEAFDNGKAFSKFDNKGIDHKAELAKVLSGQAKDSYSETSKRIIVVGSQRYYNLFSVQVIECQQSDSGKLKTPLTAINPIELALSSVSVEEIKFYTAILKYQAFYERSISDIEALKSLITNPLKKEFYYHDSSVSEKVTLRSLSPVKLNPAVVNFKIIVDLKNGVYTISTELLVNNSFCQLGRVGIKYEYFLCLDTDWYLCENFNVLNIISYFKRQESVLEYTPVVFEKFRNEVLFEMEKYVEVEYKYRSYATEEQLKDNGFDAKPEKLIYLSDLDQYVMINPVMKYGDIEIPVLTRRQIVGQDSKGNIFSVERDGDAEDAFIGLLIRQHPDLNEQLDNPLLYFYLHKNHFLDETWFLNAFEDWKNHSITVLGFNEIKGNKLNKNKAAISIYISSGLDWFNANMDVRFGKKRASVKQLHKSVRNKNKFVLLDDGTYGILPEEWLKKFEKYFSIGRIVDEALQIPKVSFDSLTEIYEADMLDKEVVAEVNRYKNKIADLKSIKSVAIPAGLNATLRSYQLQGLNWLNFLDDFNFGGCLADDMGLGKSVQIIALILLLREKSVRNVNLLVVPTSLIHNWKEEIYKFAPSVKVHIFHGADREKNADIFEQYEVILTTYNTLVSDITFLKEYIFNYVFLDEAQNIKNVTSQRYKAACLLKSRNRISISGTPFENNIFDIYAQFSFACPGLLGTKQYFRHTYVSSIDKFKALSSTADLQKKISPFILRRTKKEVATELPEKTEVVLYCEMGEEQRKVYESYEREFRDYISSNKEEEISKDPMNVLKGLTKLRQICDSPLLIDDEKLYGDRSSKIDMLMEQIRVISKEHKVLVFSQFVSMLNLIKKEFNKEGIQYTSLTGSTRNREAVVNRFQNDENIRVFLISLKAGGTGLNLTAADYVFIVDPWWNPSVENQAIDRSYRIGQKKNVIAVRLICPGTVEEKIMQMQQNKEKLASDLIHSSDSFFKSMTRDELLSLTDANTD